MPRSARAYLNEIRLAATYLLDRTSGMSYEEYNSDQTLKFAVERNFITIGEATSCLRRDHPQISSLPEAAKIVGFRNFIVHQYWAIDQRNLWSILSTEVQPLLEEVDLLLETTML